MSNNFNDMNNISDYNNFISKPVEVNTMFSSKPIRGEVIEATENSITLAPALSNMGTDDYNFDNFDKNNTYYLPNRDRKSVV